MTSASVMPPALVLGYPESTVLGVIRILGRKGIPHVDVGTRGSFVSYSRWHRTWPNPREKDPSPASLQQLLAALPVERMVLIPCADQWVAAVTDLNPALAPRFPASVAPPETVRILLDKGRFAEAAAQFGIPHPRTIRLRSQDDLASVPDAVFRDMFIKPCNSKAFLTHYGVKAMRFDDRTEARAFVADAQRAGLELLLQEHIPGPAPHNYRLSGFVDRMGTICASFAYRSLRRHPRDFRGQGGACVMSIPLEEMDGAVRAVHRLLGAVRYRGVFNAQFKYDARDRLFKLLEVNPRPWVWVGFAMACGVDVIEMAYRDALGLSVKPVTEYKVGRYALDPFTDLAAGWRMLCEGRLTLGAWLRSWWGAARLSNWDDPGPALVSTVTGVRSVVRRWLRIRQPHRVSPLLDRYEASRPSVG